MDNKLFSDLEKRNLKAIEIANPLMESISLAWKKIDTFFQDKCVLVEVTFRPDTLDYEIGVLKIKGSWRVCYCEKSEFKPIGDSPLPVRIEALDYMTELFRVVTESNEEFNSKLEDAVVKSNSVLDDILNARRGD